MKATFVMLALLIPGFASAELVQKGQPFPAYTLPNPHGVTNTLKSSTRAVIISSEKDVSGMVRDWLLTKKTDFLEQHRAEYVADITPMPAIITTLFAMPKMKKYPFPMLLADDPQFARNYPNQKGHIALFLLDDQHVVQDIHFLSNADDLDPLLKHTPH